MLKVVGAPSLDALIDEAIPARIRLTAAAAICRTGVPEHQFLRELREIAVAQPGRSGRTSASATTTASRRA